MDKFGMSGIYKLRCGMCSGVYGGQTGSSFRIRYKEHLNDIKCNRDKTVYSQHEYSKDNAALEVLEVYPKSPFLNTLQRFHIYIYIYIYIYINKTSSQVFNEQLYDS
jgi:hypothetical protein